MSLHRFFVPMFRNFRLRHFWSTDNFTLKQSAFSLFLLVYNQLEHMLQNYDIIHEKLSGEDDFSALKMLTEITATRAKPPSWHSKCFLCGWKFSVLTFSLLVYNLLGSLLHSV